MPTDEPLHVAWISLGCPKNLIDSERMLALLARAGCLVPAPMDQADVIVVNTCGFLQAARDESFEVIREALACKKGGRARRVVVVGCLVNRDAEKLYGELPEIDAIVGVNDREAVVAAVIGDGRFTRAGGYRGQITADAERFRLTPRHTAYLRISEGCSRRCSFCTIPQLRGPFRSKPPEMILEEARELAADETVELNIIGQDTTGYGRDLRPPSSLARLLRRIDTVEGLRWIRLLYAYPQPFPDALIEAIAEGERIVPYVDVPLQHIADPILQRMRRGVRRKSIESLLDRLRRRLPGAVIRTTFIVGFPGETDAHFEQLLNFVRGFRFDALGVFAFSAEPGTEAARLEGQVPEAVKAQRLDRLMSAQQEIAFAANREKVGRKLNVLVDGIDEGGLCVGRYYGQAPEIDSRCFLTEPRPAGVFVPGRVVDWQEYDLLVRPE